MPARRIRIVFALAMFLAAATVAPSADAKAEAGRFTTYHDQQIAAAQLTRACLEAIKTMRSSLGIPIDPVLDPNGTGMIGAPFSELTTCFGSLTVKRTTTNPNWAALFVRYFKTIGLQRGDVIAIGATGSFPSLIVACLASAKVMELEPVLIYSVGASPYGANIPRFTLVDMLGFLSERGLLPYKPAALLLDLHGSSGKVGLFRRERPPFDRLLERLALPVLSVSTRQEGISRCRAAYDQAAAGRRIGCFVNLGASRTFSGEIVTFLALPDGLILHLPAPEQKRDRSLIHDFAARGVPVVNLILIKKVARRNGIAIDPIPMVPVGDGGVYCLE
ncbi:MAG: poly-gamma-glutamate system protein [Bacteroidota bacterium]